ncbi:unnamed protein product, partial [Amoebophrya sp. A25]
MDFSRAAAPKGISLNLMEARRIEESKPEDRVVGKTKADTAVATGTPDSSSIKPHQDDVIDHDDLFASYLHRLNQHDAPPERPSSTLVSSPTLLSSRVQELPGPEHHGDNHLHDHWAD